MLTLSGGQSLKKVVVLNPKGGSGKTTLAFGIAGYLAATDRSVALLDMDKQGSSRRWLQNRSPTLPHIEGLSPPADDSSVVVPPDVDIVVIDAPGGIEAAELIDYTCGSHAILVPVLPSDIDIHAASRLVSDLLLKAQVSRRNGRLGIVANRVKERTIAYRRLMAFLERLSIRSVGVLRDSQNYMHAAAEGRCLHEMATSQVSKDMEQWQGITTWLEDRLATPLSPRDWLRPEPVAPKRRDWHAGRIGAAATVAALATIGWFIAAGDGGQPEPGVPQAEASFDVDTEAGQAGAETLALATRNEPPVTKIVEAQLYEPVAPVELAEPPEEFAEDELRWRLTGVVQGNGERTLLLYDQHREEGVRLGVADDVDGWSVVDSGSDFAVLRNEDRMVHLALNDTATH